MIPCNCVLAFTNKRYPSTASLLCCSYQNLLLLLLVVLLSVLLLPFAITAHYISEHTLKLPAPFLHLSKCNRCNVSNDGIESQEHLLMLCPSFDTQRRSFLDRSLPLMRPLGIANRSNELLSHILLYGCKDLPADSNREILQGTISFIRETGRFN